MPLQRERRADRDPGADAPLAVIARCGPTLPIARLSGFNPENTVLVRLRYDKYMIFNANIWRASRKWL
jgi:hypothetical protein